MKICLYSPYVPQHLGGGEKYFFDVARLLAEKHDVSVMVPHLGGELTEASLQKKYGAFLGVSLAKVKFITGPLGSSASVWEKLLWSRQFEVMYYLTDGSLFFSLAGHNIVHIQIPFTGAKNGLVNRLKLLNWQVKNTNSFFTKKVVERAWQTKINEVHWPMIEVPAAFLPAKLETKEKTILHVGRFFTHQHTKRQDILVKFFKDMVENAPRQMAGWKLLLIGTVEDQAYAEQVKAAAQGYPIELVHNATRTELWQAYQRASIYWHATGYGVDELEHPEKVEHFGISTVEAMSVGCAPVVINKGGQPEVLGSQLEPWLWNDQVECQEKTLSLIRQPELLRSLQTSAIERAKTFDQATFTDTLSRMIGEPV